MIATQRESFPLAGWPVQAIRGLALALAWAFAPAWATVVEYYDADRDRYFLTADPGEMAYVETGGAGRVWVRTGYEFETAGPCLSATGEACASRPVCRFYGALPYGSGSHFYTADPGECDFVRERDRNWAFEGTPFDAYIPDPTTGQCPSTLYPVRRAYNEGYTPAANHANHRYSWDPAAQARMVARGWRNEEVVLCATAVKDAPLRNFDVRIDADRVRSGAACVADIETLRSCIGFNNLPGPRHVLGPFIAGSALSDSFMARTGLASGTVYSVDGPAIEAAAANAFVQLAGERTFGIHLDTRSRGASNLTSINPLLQFSRFAPRAGEPDERLTPWSGRYDTEVEISLAFDLRLKRLTTRNGSNAYGHPTLDVFDRRSGIHFYFIVMVFGTVGAADDVLRDGPDGNVIVATAFRQSPFGRSFGAGTMDTPSPYDSPFAEGSGGRYEFRVDRAEFARILQAARTLEPGLSADPADYVFDDYHFNNEVAGDGEIGVAIANMGLRLLRR